MNRKVFNHLRGMTLHAWNNYVNAVGPNDRELWAYLYQLFAEERDLYENAYYGKMK